MSSFQTPSDFKNAIALLRMACISASERAYAVATLKTLRRFNYEIKCFKFINTYYLKNNLILKSLRNNFKILLYIRPLYFLKNHSIARLKAINPSKNLKSIKGTIFFLLFCMVANRESFTKSSINALVLSIK